MKKIIFKLLLLATLLPFLAYAQGTLQPDGTTSAGTPTTTTPPASTPASSSTPASTNPSTTPTSTTPAPATKAQPKATPASPTIIMLPSVTIPVVTDVPTPHPRNILGIITAIVLGALGLGTLIFYGLNSNNKNKNERKCLNFKKLMEEKLNETADLKSKLENFAKEKATKEITNMITHEPTRELLLLIEKSNEEYEKLKELYEKCIAGLALPKRVFVIHGYGSNPSEHWFPWLSSEIAKLGIAAKVLTMPDTHHPKIDTWVPFIKSQVGIADEKTFFVGHSLGCIAVIRYLESLPENTKVGGVVLVAPFISPIHFHELDPFFENTLDIDKVKNRTDKIVAISSDNDPHIPYNQSEEVRDKIATEFITIHNGQHLNDKAGYKDFPLVLETLKEILN